MDQLKNGSQIRTSMGILKVRGVADLLNPTTLVSPHMGTCTVVAASC